MREQGFTMLEVLVVLSLSLTLLTIGSSVQVQVIDNYKAKHFLQLFQSDVLYLQQRTTATSDKLHLQISPSSNYYEIKKGGYGETIMRRDIPKQWKVTLLTLSMPITFSTDGTIKNPGVFRLQTKQKDYYIYFPFGKGRCYIVEM